MRKDAFPRPLRTETHCAPWREAGLPGAVIVEDGDSVSILFCEKTANKNSLRKERLAVAHGLEMWSEGAPGLQAAGDTALAVRRQRTMGAGA